MTSLSSNRNKERPLSIVGILHLLLLFLFCIGLLTYRDIPITADDNFYLDYFSSYLTDFGELQFYLITGASTNLASFIEGEPIFAVYTALSSLVLPPEFSMRLLISLTLIPHFVVAYRRGNPNCWVYILSYIFFVELGSHLSWVQLRQGLAISFLALLFEVNRKTWRIIGMIVLGLIHSSILILLPFFLIGYAVRSKLIYVGIAALSIAVFLQPNFANSLSFLMGRRESAYLAVEATYSYRYILFCLIVAAYVTLFFRKEDNKQEFIAYHAMIAIILPLFFLPTVGAFAERLFFVTRWYELWMVTRVYNKNIWPIIGYVAINLIYTVYYTAINLRFSGDAISYYLHRITG